jgi:Acylphosphatases
VNARLHVFVTGKVQGVSYRGFARRTALELGLKGWVRNLYDGRVEAVAEGTRVDLETFIGRLEAGPAAARIEDLDTRWEPYTGEFPDFKIAWLDF